MATNYPGALDSFVNPTATDTLDSATVPHAAQHDNINDAMSAVQVTLGVNPQGGSATVVARLTALDSTVAGKAATNQTMYVGTTAVAINRSSASLALTGVSIDGTAANVTGTVAVGNGGTGQTAIPLATAWALSQTYAVGDIVSNALVYYVCRVAHTSSVSILVSNTTYWAVRTPTASAYNNSAGSSVVAYTGSGGSSIGAQSISIGTATMPSSGLAVNNGSIAVSNTGNGITVSGTGGGITVSGTGGSVSVTGGNVAVSNAGNITNSGSGNISQTGSGNITASGSGNISQTGSGQVLVNSTATGSSTPHLEIKPTGSIAFPITASSYSVPYATLTVTGISTTLYVGMYVTLSGFSSGNGTYPISSINLVGNTVTLTTGTTVSGSGTMTALTTDGNLTEWKQGSSVATTPVAYVARNGTISTQGSIGATGVISTSGYFSGPATGLTGITTSNISFITGNGNYIVTDLNPQFTGAIFSAQGTPTAINATASVTAAQIMTYLITSTTAAAVTATLPSGTNMENQLTTTLNSISANTNTSFDISVINTGSNTFTFATATGWSLTGSMAVAAGTSGRFRIRKTSLNGFAMYRLS